MNERIDDTIHIRPSLRSVQEAQYEAELRPDLYAHVVMMNVHNFLVVMHHPEHQCFICNQTGEKGVKEKYIY